MKNFAKSDGALNFSAVVEMIAAVLIVTVAALPFSPNLAQVLLIGGISLIALATAIFAKDFE